MLFVCDCGFTQNKTFWLLSIAELNPEKEHAKRWQTIIGLLYIAAESSQKSFNPSIPDVLQEVELRVLNFDVCLKGYQSKENFVSKMREDSMVCAGRVMGGVDTCGVSALLVYFICRSILYRINIISRLKIYNTY